MSSNIILFHASVYSKNRTYIEGQVYYIYFFPTFKKNKIIRRTNTKFTTWTMFKSVCNVLLMHGP